MTYCHGSVKATVSYSFGNGAQDKYQTKSTPVDIVVHENNNSTDQWLVQGQGVLDSCSPEENVVYQGFSDGEPDVSPGTYYFSSSDRTCPVVYAFYQGRNLIRDGFGFFPGSVVVIPPRLGVCRLQIISNGRTVFSVSGKCPVSFTVACDDQCPEGYLKCFTTKYPGYCCLPCKPTAAKIAAIKEQVRRFNRG